MFNLNLRHILWRATVLFGKKQLVERRPDGSISRTTYFELNDMARKLAYALTSTLSLGKGERVASMCWNTLKHLALHFAVPLAGLVLHTVNLRFSDDQIVYSINKARDRVVFVDPDMLPTLQRVYDRLETVEKVIVTEPASPPEGLKTLSFDDLVKRADSNYEFADPDENDPAILCFTTGTTGVPKGVIYTHRAIFLRALSYGLKDVFALSEKDTVLNVAPMYHISSWVVPYAAALFGSNQVFPGPRPTPKTILELVLSEKVTVSDGVPTVWLDVLNYAKTLNIDKLGTLQRIIVGGSAAPEALIRAYNELGVEVIHAWGMTETCSAATSAYIKSYLSGEAGTEIRLRKKQGLPLPCIEVDLINESGQRLPWDGKSIGEVIIRGAGIIDNYYEIPKEVSHIGDWLKTGDVATIDPEGYVEIVDRLKDVIKSGGEWISSIELENAIMGHPAVREAAVVGIPHPRWGERPLALVALKEGQTLSKEELIEYLSSKHFPKYWLPDEVIFVENVPKTSVGKFDKKLIRQTYEKLYLDRDPG